MSVRWSCTSRHKTNLSYRLRLYRPRKLYASRRSDSRSFVVRNSSDASVVTHKYGNLFDSLASDLQNKEDQCHESSEDDHIDGRRTSHVDQMGSRAKHAGAAGVAGEDRIGGRRRSRESGDCRRSRLYTPHSRYVANAVCRSVCAAGCGLNEKLATLC